MQILLVHLSILQKLKLILDRRLPGVLSMPLVMALMSKFGKFILPLHFSFHFRRDFIFRHSHSSGLKEKVLRKISINNKYPKRLACSEYAVLFLS